MVIFTIILSSPRLPVNNEATMQTLRNNFLRDGYCIINDVYTEDEILRGRQIFEEAFRNKDWQQAPFSSETIINDIYTFYPSLINIVFNEKYCSAIKQITGQNAGIIPECAVHHNRYFDWHKDTTSGEANGNKVHHHPDALFIVAATYFQANSPAGGGLTVVPGSQYVDDRFVQMYYGNIFHRIKNKLQKITGTSVFHKIEKHENVIDIMHKTGDLVLFNLSLDHRATFIRNGRNGKPVESNMEKFAVFNTFSPATLLAQQYADYLKTRKEPYYQYLRSSILPEAFLNKMTELGIKVYS